MVRLEVTTTGLDPLIARLNGSQKHTQAEMRTAMTTSLVLVEGEMKRLAPRDTGRLQGSITHKITGGGSSLTGVVAPGVRYGYWVEYGRRPGKRPPIDAISGWARRHGGNPFMIARAIGRRGTRKQPFVAPALQKHEGKIRQIFSRLGVQIAAYIAG